MGLLVSIVVRSSDLLSRPVKQPLPRVGFHLFWIHPFIELVYSQRIGERNAGAIEVKTRSPHGHRTSVSRLTEMQRAKSPPRGLEQLMRRKCCARLAGHETSRRCVPAFAWPVRSGHQGQKSCRLSRSAQHLTVRSRFQPAGARCRSQAADRRPRSPDTPCAACVGIPLACGVGRSAMTA